MIDKLNGARKAVTALVTGWLGWAAVVVASAPGPITASEWLAFGVVTATAIGVYGVPNDPPIYTVPAAEPVVTAPPVAPPTVILPDPGP